MSEPKPTYKTVIQKRWGRKTPKICDCLRKISQGETYWCHYDNHGKLIQVDCVDCRAIGAYEDDQPINAPSLPLHSMQRAETPV